MSTINSFGHPYCNIELFLVRFDVRTVEDLLSDNDVRLTPTQVAASPILLSLLKEASAYVESYATKGTRYSIADLILIANMDNNGLVIAQGKTNSNELLYGIVAGIAMFYLWERRPQRTGTGMAKMSRDIQRRIEYAFMKTEELGAGEMIFGLLENAASSIPQPEFMTEQDFDYRNFSSNQARRFFGDRAEYQVPGP